MALTDLQLINTALIKLGAQKITSLLDTTTEAEVANTLFAPVRDAFLASYPWGFATVQVTLDTPSMTPPVADYTYAFDLPVDHLRTLSVGGNGLGAGATYRQQNNRIETDASTIILTYIKRPAEGTMPAYADLALVARLSSEMCVPLTENASRAEILYRLAESEVARARHTDAQQDTPQRLNNYSLINARGA